MRPIYGKDIPGIDKYSVRSKIPMLNNCTMEWTQSYLIKIGERRKIVKNGQKVGWGLFNMGGYS